MDSQSRRHTGRKLDRSALLQIPADFPELSFRDLVLENLLQFLFFPLFFRSFSYFRSFILPLVSLIFLLFTINLSYTLIPLLLLIKIYSFIIIKDYF